jgi:HrpA-like RNA helicase
MLNATYLFHNYMLAEGGSTSPPLPLPKVIFMSATLDMEALVAYFQTDSTSALEAGASSSLSTLSSSAPAASGLSVAAASVEGRTYPVQRLFLSDALEHSGYNCFTGWRGYARAEVTPAALANTEGSGATPEDRGKLPAAGGEKEEAVGAIELSEMTLGQKMIAENLAKRAQKAANEQSNSAAGVGSIGGEVQAWIDRVGQVGMAAFDPALARCSKQTLDTLRQIDHTQVAVNFDLITALVRHLVRQNNGGGLSCGGGKGTSGKASNGGAVLVFMPGLQEITDLIATMRGDTVLGHSTVVILPLHSELTTAEQKLVFRRGPVGGTKVVVATNIAEASITIEDVTAVIDCGTHKEMLFDQTANLACLKQTRISAANATQRAGRAGALFRPTLSPPAVLCLCFDCVRRICGFQAEEPTSIMYTHSNACIPQVEFKPECAITCTSGARSCCLPPCRKCTAHR